MKSIAYHRAAALPAAFHISRSDALSRVALGVCRWLSKNAVVATASLVAPPEQRQSEMRSVWHVTPSAGYLGWQMRRNRVR